MSSHDNNAATPIRRDVAGSLFIIFIVLLVASFVGAFVVFWPDEVPVKQTLLEQRAGALTTANVEICGLTAAQLDTGIGVVNIGPNMQALIVKQMHAGIHSVIEIAYSPDDMTVHLVGDANVTRGVRHCP